MKGSPYATGHIFAQINFGFQLIVLTEVGTMVVGGWKSYLFSMMEKELSFICVNHSRSCPNLLVSDKSDENFPERCRKFGFLEPAIEDLLWLDLGH